MSTHDRSIRERVLLLVDGRYPWASFDERRKMERSTDPLDGEALAAYDALIAEGWAWVEQHEPVPWHSDPGCRQHFLDHLSTGFPWFTGVLHERILRWAMWLSWHEGFAELVE